MTVSRYPTLLPLHGNSCGTPSLDIFVDKLVGHSCDTLVDTTVGHSWGDPYGALL